MLKRAATAPATYVLWAIFVVAILALTRTIDPYVYAFATLGLVGLTGVVAVVGLAVTLLDEELASRARALILGALLVAAAALSIALAALRRIHWA